MTDSDPSPAVFQELADRRHGWRASAVVWLASLLAFALGLALTVWGLAAQRSAERAARQAEFAQLVDDTQEALVSRLLFGGMVVRAAQIALSAYPEVTPEVFDRVIDRLRPAHVFPGMHAMIYTFPSREGEPPRRLTRLVDGVGSAADAGAHVDEISRRWAGFSAVAQGDAVAMSAPFALSPDTAAQPDEHVVMRLQVLPADGDVPDAGQRPGSIALSFHAGDVIGATLPEAVRDRFRVRVADVGGGRPLPLFDSHPGTAAAKGARLGQRLRFGGRTWQVELVPQAKAWPASGSAWRDPVMWAGLLASLVLGALVWFWGDTRRRALVFGQQMTQRYQDTERRFRSLNELLPALVLLVDPEDGKVQYANRAARTRFGDAVGRGLRLGDLLAEAEDAQRLDQAMASEPGGPPQEVLLRDHEGTPFWSSVNASTTSLDGISHQLLVISDVSGEHSLRSQLKYQASHDDLTQIFNRREFEQRLAQMLRAVDPARPQGAMLYIDLDQFKLVNDTSGHAAGDQLLRHLALGMAKQLRGGDIIARLGGDEFGVLAPDSRREGAEVLAQRLREYIESYHFVWDRQTYKLSASIGVVLIERHDLSTREVMAQADSACYIAKDSGRNRIHFHADLDQATVKRSTEMEWATRLRRVVADNRLRLDYQEIRSLRFEDRDSPHIELLLRVLGEDGGLVLPGAFLPAAERYGLMPMLDRWVITEAITHFAGLHPSGPLLGRCSINLSAASLDEDEVADEILRLLALHKLPPGRLCFEITETEAVRNHAQLVRFVDRLRFAGCLVALDDFGSGMSSFGYLRELPVDVIKIDGSFVQNLDDDPMGHSIVKAVTEISHQQGLDVVAEWVDSEDTLRALRKIGVDYAQGDFLHAPERVLYQRGASAAC